MTRFRISKNFVVEEFDCHDGTKVPSAAHDALQLWAKVWGEPLRDAFGPVRVTSGFRTTSYNRSVGGAPSSFHVYSLRYGPNRGLAVGVGVAADVVPARGGPADWQKWAQAYMSPHLPGLQGSRGAAVAYSRQGFIHLDTGPRRTWAA